MKLQAARIGPTVLELDGPITILNISTQLSIFIYVFLKKAQGGMAIIYRNQHIKNDTFHAYSLSGIKNNTILSFL